MKKKLKVLLVEDSDVDADLILHQLRSAKISFVSKVVFTRTDFVKSLDELQPDIVLSDFSMPSFDGLSALKILKKKTPNTPFVFVSGTIGEERAISAIKNGATDYILKDHISGLVPKVKRALREAREREEKIMAIEHLKQSQLDLAEAQRTARIGNWHYDLTTEEIEWSEEIFKICGYLPNKVKPSIDLYLSLIHPEDFNYIFSYRKEVYNNQTPFSYTTRIICQNSDQVKYLYVKGNFKRDSRGTSAYGIIQDITELKRTEKRLEDTNKELKTLIYKASHDIRGPLCSALGLCNLGMEESENESVSLQYFGLVNQSLQKLDRVISALVETVSIKEEDDTTEQIDLHKMLDFVMGKLSKVQGYEHIKFIREVSCKNFHSSPNLLQTIFLRILENSVKLRDGDKESFIKVKIQENSGGINVEVTDNGIGLDDNIASHAFDMFFRGTEKSQGSGLGLYVVKNAIERLKGFVEISPVEGGCRVNFFIPNSF